LELIYQFYIRLKVLELEEDSLELTQGVTGSEDSRGGEEAEAILGAVMMGAVMMAVTMGAMTMGEMIMETKLRGSGEEKEEGEIEGYKTD
jgi:hypothetical protein